MCLAAMGKPHVSQKQRRNSYDSAHAPKFVSGKRLQSYDQSEAKKELLHMMHRYPDTIWQVGTDAGLLPP